MPGLVLPVRQSREAVGEFPVVVRNPGEMPACFHWKLPGTNSRGRHAPHAAVWRRTKFQAAAMKPATNSDPRQNRWLIVVLTSSALLTAGHFISERHASGVAADATARAQVSRV
jgi:hypothetical protein